MKIRNGFVSNSSSSSFICDYCGTVESGYDCCLDDFGMTQCEKGHTFCKEHMKVDFNLYSKEGLEYIKSLMEKDKWYKDEEVMKAINTCLEEQNYDYDRVAELLPNKDFHDIFQDLLYDIGVPAAFCPVCQRLETMKKDKDYEEYSKLFDKFDGVKPNGCR